MPCRRRLPVLRESYAPRNVTMGTTPNSRLRFSLYSWWSATICRTMPGRSAANTRMISATWRSAMAGFSCHNSARVVTTARLGQHSLAGRFMWGRHPRRPALRPSSPRVPGTAVAHTTGLRLAVLDDLRERAGMAGERAGPLAYRAHRCRPTPSVSAVPLAQSALLCNSTNDERPTTNDALHPW